MNLPHMASECNTQISKLIIEVSEVEGKIQLPGTQHELHVEKDVFCSIVN